MIALEHLEAAWRNPFDGDVARTHSAYYGRLEGELVRLLEVAPATPWARVAHDAFRSFVLDDAFSCLGAKSALQRATYRFGAYARLADPGVTQGLARDLYAFAAERRGFASAFTTYVAVFREQVADGEHGFERALWSQLQQLHDVDVRYHAWDPSVSDDPGDARFSFSIAGQAFFVIGLHPGASRRARRFAWPALAFNAHDQFEALRVDGRYAGLRARIRERERLLDGELNPNLADYGERSEAAQYSGRAVEQAWRCPFHPRR